MQISQTVPEWKKPSVRTHLFNYYVDGRQKIIKSHDSCFICSLCWVQCNGPICFTVTLFVTSVGFNKMDQFTLYSIVIAIALISVQNREEITSLIGSKGMTLSLALLGDCFTFMRIHTTASSTETLRPAIYYSMISGYQR